MPPVRVLHVVNNLGQGGVQRYLMAYLEHMDRDRVQFDFAVQVEEVGDLEARAHELDAEVFHLPSSINSRRAFEADFSRLLKGRGYDIVEAHQNHRCLFPLTVAKRCGVPRRIAHSHSSYRASSIFTRAYRGWFKARIGTVATDLWGCSKLANEWLYGGRLAVRASVIPNAIDVSRFVFNRDVRDEVRGKLGISGPCIGHVGAGGTAKNYPFIIDIFEEVLSRDPNAHLLLVGCGEKSQGGGIARAVADRGLTDSVTMTGLVADPERFLSAMDSFMLPSLCEGMSIALIEAQANGLRPLASKGAVPEEANITGCVGYLPLNAGAEIWAEELLKRVAGPRYADIAAIENTGYGMKTAAERLERRYVDMVGML